MAKPLEMCASFEIQRFEKGLRDCKDLRIILLFSFLQNNENVIGIVCEVQVAVRVLWSAKVFFMCWKAD